MRPICFMRTAHLREVPHADFAAAQDDIGFKTGLIKIGYRSRRPPQLSTILIQPVACCAAIEQNR